MKIGEYEIEVARSVLGLANRIIANRNRHINELGITTEQADSLRFFEEHSHAGIKDLRNYLGVKRQTAQGIVQRLLEKGMIASSISDTDGRCKEIVLTDAGIQMLKNLSINGSHTGKAGCLSAAVSMLNLTFLENNLILFVAAAFMAGGYGIMCSVSQSAVILLAGRGKRGVANSTYYVGLDLGMALGPFLALVADSIYKNRISFYALGKLFLCKPNCFYTNCFYINNDISFAL